MKTIFLVTFLSFCLWFCDATGNKDRTAEKLSSLVSDTIDYQSQIQPILQDKCSPCHFAGGKMYERMPFDKGETIIDHQAGILKRIKDEQKAILIREYIRQHAK